MRQSARILAWSSSLMLLAACGTAPRSIELRPFDGMKVQDNPCPQNQVLATQDINGILDQAGQAASMADKAKVLSLLHQARATLGAGAMSAGSKSAAIAKHLEQAISQISAADVNVREVASIEIRQLQDTVKAAK